MYQAGWKSRINDTKTIFVIQADIILHYLKMEPKACTRHVGTLNIDITKRNSIIMHENGKFFIDVYRLKERACGLKKKWQIKKKIFASG